MKKILVLPLLVMAVASQAQSLSNIQLEHMQKQSVRNEIEIPNILGFQTLKCDFHMHTIFSDGIAWPTYRVDEAWEEGLDAIAITDHIENQPSKLHVGGDHNASYDIALPRAEEKNILLIRAGEITRSMPPGHLNALFLKDVNLLDTPDPVDAIKAAVDQGGFVMWNHPGWKAQQPDTCVWMEMHQLLFEKKYIHGIEVFNEKEWYPIVLDWCLDRNLAVIANSDIHDINAHFYDLVNGHRPMTLVFAKDRSIESIKEAMFANRTVAFFDNKLAGKEIYLKAIFDASVSMKPTGKTDKKGRKYYEISNRSDIPFVVENLKNEQVTLPALATIILAVDEENFSSITVKNLFIASQTNLKIRF